MARFKVGDRVKILGNGDVTTVEKIDRYYDGAAYWLSDGYGWYADKDIEPAEESEDEDMYSDVVKVLDGISPDAPIVTNEKGGKQSRAEYAFHMCDYEALMALAKTLAYGASRYERDNWRLIPAEEHFNHMMIHAIAHLMGDKQDDHLGHAFCRAMMFYATAKAEEESNV